MVFLIRKVKRVSVSLLVKSLLLKALYVIKLLTFFLFCPVLHIAFYFPLFYLSLISGLLCFGSCSHFFFFKRLLSNMLLFSFVFCFVFFSARKVLPPPRSDEDSSIFSPSAEGDVRRPCPILLPGLLSPSLRAAAPPPAGNTTFLQPRPKQSIRPRL